jgi:hypothetical protein
VLIFISANDAVDKSPEKQRHKPWLQKEIAFDWGDYSLRTAGKMDKPL